MTSLISLNKEILKYFDYSYFIKFLLLFLGLYGFNYCYIGLLDDTGIMYSSVLSHHFNYVDWFRVGLIHASNFLAQWFGLDSYIDGVKHIRVTNGPSVMLGRPCLGMGMIIFWIAFVSAHSSSWKEKLTWSLSGVLAICIINCFRIALLLVALKEKWNINRFMNHHDMFNLFAYALILGLIILYNKQYATEKATPV